ncbi:dihydrodipicolinate synthase family protein [Kribbella deserti]|uniref:Dihydrodipicolinate synthase family protein n=1 Tax=Kribbella deserti TaxID=1926257 RepID=A0ABV6QVA6_9ACTN
MTLSGLYVPLITPFDSDGTVALDALEALAHRLLDAGATGLVALGTTAEPTVLSAPERHAVLDVIARVCGSRGAQLVVGAESPQGLAELRDRPEVVAAQIPVPAFVRPGEDGVVAYFTHLASISPVPLVIYHIPYRTGQALSPACLRRLAGIPGVIAFKYAAGGIDADTIELLADPRPGFAIMGGDDVVVSPLLALGASGAILASAHLATSDFVALINAWRSGDVARARALGHRLAAMSARLFAEPNPTVIKAVLYAEGLIPTPAVRLPLVAASPASVEAALASVAGHTHSTDVEGSPHVPSSEVPSMR